MTTISSEGVLESTGTSLLDPGFWRLPMPERESYFARLRSLEHPVHFSGGKGVGFHALVRHADVTAASRAHGMFTNAPGATTPPPARWVRTLFGDSMVNLDGPEHLRLRRVVSQAFTPRLLARTTEDIRATAVQLLEEAAATRAEDFVTAVAAPLPFRVICAMLGIPARQQEEILTLVGRASQHTGVRRGTAQRLRDPGRGLRALARLQFLITRIGRERRRRPADDLITTLVRPGPDGERLTGRELGAFFSLLLVAGVETTRNALAHGMHLLTVHPEQREILLSDPVGRADGAMEEITRYSSPIIQFRRTVSRSGEMNGHAFSAGDNVILFYNSANRDASVFDDPDVFDITRSPNPHTGFGGGGPHHCLGAHLARQEMRALFGELFLRYPRARATGDPQLVPSSFDNRVKSLGFTLTR